VIDYINSIDFIVRSMEEGKVTMPVIEGDQNSNLSKDDEDNI